VKGGERERKGEKERERERKREKVSQRFFPISREILFTCRNSVHFLQGTFSPKRRESLYF
jgi:hypothetical protein